MHEIRNWRLAVVGAICLMSLSQQTYAAIAGHVQFVSGNVQIVAPTGQSRTAQKGDAINEGDTLLSAPKSTAQVKMQDGGFIALRAETRLKFDQFRFSGKEDGEERSFFSLFKGGFRAVTGLIGRINKQNYRINTPAATIGIRGTDHETVVVAPNGNTTPSGTYNMVNVGETSMTTDMGTVNIRPGSGMGYSSGMNQQPVIRPLNPQLFGSTQEPSPQEGQGNGDQEGQGNGEQEGQGSGDQEGQGNGDQEGQGNGEQEAQNNGEQESQGGEADGEPQTQGGEGGTEDPAAGGDAAQGGEPSAGTATADAGTTDTSTVRESAVVDSGGGVATASPTTATAPVGGTGTAPAPVQDTVPVTLTDPNLGTLNLTTTTLTTTTGQTAPVTVGTVAVPYSQTDVAVAVAYHSMYGMGYYGSQSFVTAPANISPTGNPPSFTGFPTCLECGPTPSVSLPGAAGLIGGQAGAFATTGISFGRWSNAPVLQVTSPAYSFGPNTMYGVEGPWGLGVEGYLDSPIVWGTSTGPLSGTVTYLLEGGSAPTDWMGNTGTLNNLGLTANFTNQTVDATLNVTFNATNYVGSAVGMPINTYGPNGQGGTFYSSSAGMTVTNTSCPSCTGVWGDLNGAFTGQNYAGALVAYYIGDSDFGHYFDGTAALKRNSAVANGTPAPTGNFVVAQYGYLNTANSATVNANGMLSSMGWSWTDAASGTTYTSSRTVTCATCTGTTAPVSGIKYGSWDGAGSVTWIDRSPLSGRQFHWITGPAVDPPYLPEVLTGTITYTLDGATAPTNQNGVVGVLNSATLTVNFTKQVVGINLALAVNGHAWTASTPVGGESPLEYMGKASAKSGFHATSGNLGIGQLNVALDGVASTSWGQVSGQLTGNGLNGAVLQYDLSGQLPNGTFEEVAGVAALKATTAANTATPYRIVAFSAYDPAWMGSVTDGAYNNAARVTLDAAGNVTGFDAAKMGAYGGMAGYAASDVRALIGTATAVNRGADPVSGISWGRWQGGTINIVDRVTGAVSAMPNGQASLHWVAGPQMTGPVGLPISGTFNYVLAGGTTPTDQNGNLGVLNSASLSANFTAKTVNVGVNVTMTGHTLNASGVNVPIQSGGMFGASNMMMAVGNNNAPLTATCTGPSCGAVEATIQGAFTGATGNGAGMIYGINNGMQVISGVAAFHR